LGQGALQVTVLPLLHTSTTPVQASNLQVAALLSLQVTEHAAPGWQTTGWQVLSLQRKAQVLFGAQVVVQLPPVHSNSHVLLGPQVQALPTQLPLHFGLLPAQVTAQLPPSHLRSHLLFGPQVQALPTHSPLQLGLSPAQVIAQLPSVHERSQLAPFSHVQAPLEHSPTQVLPA
jgi:hypothetical protein